MARKNPVPSREIQIGSRLREAREAAGLSRVAMAKRLGIDGANLANYEHGRVPAPYHAAARIAAFTNASQRWLALGKSPRAPYFKVPALFDSGVPKPLLFSFVYDVALAEEIDSTIAAFSRTFGTSENALIAGFQALGNPPLMQPGATRNAMLASTLRSLERLANALPDAAKPRFLSALLELEGKFLSDFAGDIDEAILGGKAGASDADKTCVEQQLSLLNSEKHRNRKRRQA